MHISYKDFKNFIATRQRPRGNKYGVGDEDRRTVDNIKFHSIKEAKYYIELKLLVAAGEVVYFLRQVPLRHPSGVTLVIDFVVFYADKTVRYIDVKGYETPQFKTKKKLIENYLPIEIETV